MEISFKSPESVIHIATWSDGTGYRCGYAELPTASEKIIGLTSTAAAVAESVTRTDVDTIANADKISIVLSRAEAAFELKGDPLDVPRY